MVIELDGYVRLLALGMRGCLPARRKERKWEWDTALYVGLRLGRRFRLGLGLGLRLRLVPLDVVWQ